MASLFLLTRKALLNLMAKPDGLRSPHAGEWVHPLLAPPPKGGRMSRVIDEWEKERGLSGTSSFLGEGACLLGAYVPFCAPHLSPHACTLIYCILRPLVDQNCL